MVDPWDGECVVSEQLKSQAGDSHYQLYADLWLDLACFPRAVQSPGLSSRSFLSF